jgi:hypothetical protein
MPCRCGESIPRVGGGAEKVNCFVVYLNKDKGDSIMLVDSFGQHQISGRRLDRSQRFAIHDYFPLYQAIHLEVEIRHFYGGHEFIYNSIFDYLARSCSGWDRLCAISKNLLEALLQWLFNRRRLVADKRFGLLEFLVDNYSNKDTFGVLSIMQDKYGIYVFGRPDFFNLLGEVESQLRLLVETSDLQKINGDYRITGHAWKAVSDYQETDRRVLAETRVQICLICLSATIVILTAGQAGVIKFPTMWDFRTEAEKVINK